MMKSSLGKQLKRFALNKSDAKEKKDHQLTVHLDVLAQASQDMKDMRNCCDSLLSAAAATTNSAYEFSESLLEMGSCFMERTVMDDNGECGRALSCLGKVQLELQKLVDLYRAHVIQTVTNPSESLLSELRKVEEMKLQCDGKREMYEHLVTQQREKGKSKIGKRESFTTQQQLQAAREEYEEVARLCVFRVESLKQGQCRSLLTQAARHHTAQLIFFRKGLKSLEAVEPYIRSVAQNQHIDCEVGEVADAEDVNDGGNSYGPQDDGELSFDNRLSRQEQENVCTSRNSMEVDQEDAPTTQASGLEEFEHDFGRKKADHFIGRRSHVSSHSAPIYAEKLDLLEKQKQKQTPTPKILAYALPTPSDAKSSTSKTAGTALHSSGASIAGNNSKMWHSSPLDMDEPRKLMDESFGARHVSKAQAVVKDRDNRYPSVPLPSPLLGGVSSFQVDSQNGFDFSKVERQAFSGPLLSKPSSAKPISTSSGPVALTEVPQSYSGMLSRLAVPLSSSTPGASQSVSPPLASSPRISELHELPRPPASLDCKLAGLGVIGHSAPFFSRSQGQSATNKFSLLVSAAGSLHPLPPVSLARSFSIPSSNSGAAVVPVAKLKDSPLGDKVEGSPSPPLTPISLSSIASTTVSAQLPSAISNFKVVGR